LKICASIAPPSQSPETLGRISNDTAKMKNWFKTFRTKYYYDRLPKQTKILTFTLMPIICIVFIGVSIHLNKQINLTKNDYQLINGKISNTIRKDNTQSSTFDLKITIEQTELSLNSNVLRDTVNISLIKANRIADVYFDKRDNTIVQMYIDEQKILDLSDYSNQLKTSRNITFTFGILFTLWFISRLYRYKKYGSLN